MSERTRSISFPGYCQGQCLKDRYPLVPLAKNGKRHEIVEEMITVLAAAEQYELLAQAKTTAGLVFKESVDHEWLERIFAVYKDIIEESWVYQETIQKGLEKGLEVGLEKGLEKGKLEGKLAALHQVILDVIQERFPDIMPYARKQIEDFEDYEVLRRVNVKMITVQTPEEALQVLIALSKNDKNN